MKYLVLLLKTFLIYFFRLTLKNMIIFLFLTKMIFGNPSRLSNGYKILISGKFMDIPLMFVIFIKKTFKNC